MSIFEYDEEKEIKLIREAEYNKGIRQGIEQGIEQGMEQGVKILVKNLRRLQQPDEVIIQTIIEDFSVTEEQARTYL